MSQALRKLTAIVAKSKTCLIFINQIREKIGVMFGNPETTTGGRALKFYSSVRLDIRRTTQIKEGDEVVGSRVKVKVVKNKCAAPFVTRSSTLATAKGSPRPASCWTSGSRTRSSRSRDRGSRTATSGSARDGRTPRPSSRRTPTSPPRSSRRSGACWAWADPSYGHRRRRARRPRQSGTNGPEVAPATKVNPPRAVCARLGFSNRRSGGSLLL